MRPLSFGYNRQHSWAHLGQREVVTDHAQAIHTTARLLRGRLSGGTVVCPICKALSCSFGEGCLILAELSSIVPRFTIDVV